MFSFLKRKDDSEASESQLRFETLLTTLSTACSKQYKIDVGVQLSAEFYAKYDAKFKIPRRDSDFYNVASLHINKSDCPAAWSGIALYDKIYDRKYKGPKDDENFSGILNRTDFNNILEISNWVCNDEEIVASGNWDQDDSYTHVLKDLAVYEAEKEAKNRRRTMEDTAFYKIVSGHYNCYQAKVALENFRKTYDKEMRKLYKTL